MNDVAAIQRRTVRVLMVSQALGGLGITIGIAVASVLAEDVSGKESLAGLAQTAQVFGTAVASYVLGRVMDLHGRRVGIGLGYLAGSCGALLCVVGGAARIFPLLLLGAFLLGVTSASNYQSRYAAADLADPAHRARALATVVWATTIGAVLGPNLTGPSGDLADALGLPRLTGPFVITIVVVLTAAVVVQVCLRPDPLLVAREEAGFVRSSNGSTSWSRVGEVLRERPRVLAAMIAQSCAHAVMVGVMVMTPLHMHDGGADLEVIGLVISFHVLGMFAFAPFVGAAADRFGRPRTLATGSVVLLLALVLAGSSPMGTSWRIGVGMFLLGVGWSLCTVSAAALLTEAAPLDARTDVQGAADLVMNLAAALAGGFSGVIVQWQGFGLLNATAAILLVGVVAAVSIVRTADGADAREFLSS